MKKRLTLSLFCSAICFIVSYAVICPKIEILNEDNTVTTLTVSPQRYLLTAAITLVAFSAFFAIDYYFKISDRLCNYFKNKFKRIVLFWAGVVGTVALSALIEVIFRLFYGADSAGKTFNIASFCTVASILLCAFVFVFERKNLSQKPERAVALIILIAGTLIIATEPFSHNSSDEDTHYYLAAQNSFVGNAYLTDADKCVQATTDFAISNDLKSSNERIELMNERGKYSTFVTKVNNSIPHRAAGSLIAVARLFGADFHTRFICGQFGMLLTYALTVYFAIRKLKSGKMIMSVIALFPTNIVLASNYSYDPWVTGFSLLGTAYFVSEMQQPQKRITVFETVIMCGAFVLAALPKQLYVMLLILPMFMRKSNFTKYEKRRYYAILLSFFAFMLILFTARSFSEISGSGDLRGGNVNPAEQLNYILSNPIKYAKILLSFLWGYLSPLNAKNYISFFSYLGKGSGAIIFILLLCFCAVTDKDETNKFKGSVFTAALVIITDLIIACMMATALYIAFTPVFSQEILGCHPRYIIPLVAPFALTVINPGKPLKVNKTVYSLAVLAVITACLIFNILRIVTLPML